MDWIGTAWMRLCFQYTFDGKPTLSIYKFSCMMRRMGLDNKMERGCCSTDCSILVPQNITRMRLYSDTIG